LVDVSLGYYLFGFSAAFSVLLGLNFIVVEAAICTGSPVRGLRPVRAWRLDVENEPKPGHDTLSPLFADSTTRSTNDWMTRSASADETPVFAATAARRSALVIAISLLSRNRSSVSINLNASADKMQASLIASRHSCVDAALQRATPQEHAAPPREICNLSEIKQHPQAQL